MFWDVFVVKMLLINCLSGNIWDIGGFGVVGALGAVWFFQVLCLRWWGCLGYFGFYGCRRVFLVLG